MLLQPGATSWNKLSEERKRAYREYLRRERDRDFPKEAK